MVRACSHDYRIDEYANICDQLEGKEALKDP